MKLKSCLLYGVLWGSAAGCGVAQVSKETRARYDLECRQDMETVIRGEKLFSEKCFLNFLVVTDEAVLDLFALKFDQWLSSKWEIMKDLPKKASMQEVEAHVLLSLFLGDAKILTDLLTTHEEAREYLRKRFYRDNALLTHLAAASPYSSPELLGALFANKWFCSKAKLMDGRMAWEVAQDLGYYKVAEFAKGRAESCKGTPVATPLPDVIVREEEKLAVAETKACGAHEEL